LHLWTFLKYTQRNLLIKEQLWPHQLFVDDQRDIKCVLFIYLTIGFKSNNPPLTDERTTARRVTFFCDDKDDQLLISLIQQYVLQSNIKNISFCAIPHRLSSVIGSFINDQNLGKYYTSSFQQMELDKETFAEKRKQITSPSSGNYFIIYQEKK
jgi:hypothetical protein